MVKYARKGIQQKERIVVTDTSTYYHINRDEWKQYQNAHHLALTLQELEHLTSLNDRISLIDVQEVYVPLLDYFDIYYQKHGQIHEQEQYFLKQPKKKVPFIIGVSGSVAVGKSTTARLMQTMLQQKYPELIVELMTTDGFLWPTKHLVEKGILHRKGFPESYDMESLVNFLLAIKTGEEAVEAPVYSHEIYDIIPNEKQVIYPPDILIVEGINVLQLPPNREIYVSDFFDWSIYVDAEENLIEKWYLERFELLMERAKTQPDNFYYQFAIGDREEAIAMAKDVWKKTNLKNLNEYILPTKGRADFILHKTYGHHIDYVQVKKY